MARPCDLDDMSALLGGSYATVLEANVVVGKAVLVLKAGELLAKRLDFGLDVGHLATLLDAVNLVAKDVALLLVDLDAAGKDGREQEEAGAADEHVAADVQRHGGGLGHGVAVAGGLDEAGPIVNGSPAQVIEEVSRFLTETNLTGVMVGPGCVTTTSNIPENNITATRLVVERYGDKDLWKYLSMDSSCL